MRASWVKAWVAMTRMRPQCEPFGGGWVAVLIVLLRGFRAGTGAPAWCGVCRCARCDAPGVFATSAVIRATNSGLASRSTISVWSSMAMRSSRRPSRIIRPWKMMPTWSQTSCTCSSRWEHRNTVMPRSRSLRIKSRICREPTGSTPAVGSSRMTRRGSCTNACARPMRWSMPFE